MRTLRKKKSEILRIKSQNQQITEQINSFINSSYMAVFSLNPNGLIESSNSYFLNLLQETDNSLPIINIFDKIHTDDKILLQNQFNKLLNNEITESSLECRFIKKDQSIVWFYVVLKILNSIKTNTPIINCTGYLIDKFKQSEQKLKKAHKELMTANQEVIFSVLELEKQRDEIIAQKEEIEKQNISTMASINYAGRIQYAILPQADEVKKAFPDSFVFYQPRDIVSGDFFWLSNIKITGVMNALLHNYTVLAVADCTGHGVPGAFMTIIGNSFLEEIINVRKINKPAEILKELDQKIVRVLKQDNSESSISDGMAVGIIVIDHDRNQIHFSGAKCPLAYISNGELRYIKGSRYSTGGKVIDVNSKNFENHTIQFYPNDCFYIYTDGFFDQVGGDKNRKFMSVNFLKLLEEIHKNNFENQREILMQTFDNWKGTKKQVDDVLVIGFKAPYNNEPNKELQIQYDWSGCSILIVDDQEWAFTAIKVYLNPTNATIYWAKNGLEAIDLVKKIPIHIILMDIEMPVMDGNEATRRIKQMQPEIPIIMQTGYSSHDRHESFTAGCDDYIIKPIKYKELVATMSKYIFRTISVG